MDAGSSQASQLNFMFGKLLSSTIKIATLPVDAVNVGFDVLCGGNGSKHSRTELPTPTSLLEQVRDRVAEAAEEIDD